MIDTYLLKNDGIIANGLICYVSKDRIMFKIKTEGTWLQIPLSLGLSPY